MTRTIVTSELSGVGDGDTAEVSADSEDDEPLGLLHTLAVSLGVSESGRIDCFTILNLCCCSVSDEERLSTIGSSQTETTSHQIAEASPVLCRLRGLGRVVLHGGAAVVGEVGHVHITSVQTPHLAGDSQAGADPHLTGLQQVLRHGEGGQRHHWGLHSERGSSGGHSCRGGG